MSARRELAEALKLGLPENKYRIVPAAFPPGNIARPTILVWQDNISRLPQAALNPVSLDITVWILVPTEDPEKAEDQLEDAVGDVLLALEDIPTLTWSLAERVTFGDADGPSFHSYRITLNTRASIGA